MGENTQIEWCDHTFNPWVGCTPVSPACDNCYAEGWAKRAGRHAAIWGPHGRPQRTAPATWDAPLRWASKAAAAGIRQTVFAPSLGDPWDNRVDPAIRRDFFDLIRATADAFDWLLLTKRPQNILYMADEAGGLPKNVALGVTVEDQPRADQRVPALLAAAAVLHPLYTFVSCEPLLGPTDLTAICTGYYFINALRGIKYHDAPEDMPSAIEPCGHLGQVIVGGESGSKARDNDFLTNARSLLAQCRADSVPFFGKQNVRKAPLPDDLMIREFPEPRR